jgi:hypothetical protein
MKGLGGEIIDMWDSKSCATKCGGLSPLWNIILCVVGWVIIQSRNGTEIELFQNFVYK